MEQARGTTHRVDGKTKVSSQTLWTVQWMRAAAALMVVIGHSQSAVATAREGFGADFARSTLLPWGAGVDLFFVISGFIMVHASQRLFGQPGAARAFLSRRMARIIPLYWLVTTLFLALLGAASLKGGDPFPGPAAIATSYLFLPFDAQASGHAFPVFDLGWTLNYEMFFYALFAVAVGWRRRAALSFVVGALLVIVILGMFVAPASTALYFWSRPIILDFGLGILVATAMSAGLRLPDAVRIALVVFAVALLAADPLRVFDVAPNTTVANAWPRVAFAGVAAAALLAGAVLGPEPAPHAALRPITYLGDASYSLYLVHPFALILMEKAVQKSPEVRALDGATLVIVTIIAAILLALAAYRWVERPMTAVAKRLLVRRARRPTSSAIIQEASI